jgi:hypothetical protein
MSEEQKTAKELELEKAQAEADAYNKTLTGVGTRRRVGQTRGKNPVVISWDAYDESQPATLPTTIAGFMENTGVKDEPTLVSFLIGGYNDANYTAASDPLAEFVNPAWPQEAQTQFRLVVRNYSRGASVSLEDAVTLIKPGFEKQFAPATPEKTA